MFMFKVTRYAVAQGSEHAALLLTVPRSVPGVKVAGHVHQASTLYISGAMPPRPHTSSWRVA